MLLFESRGVRPEWAAFAKASAPQALIAGTERAPTGAIGVREARRGGTI